jgi:hypothetical protein
MSESSNKEKMEETDDGVAQKSGSSSEMKPLKRVVISGGLAKEEGEKEALCGQSEESQAHVKHPASVSSMRNRKHKSSSDPTFVRRVGSTATNDRGFERPASQLGSRKSLASVKTRTASVSRSEYHADLKLGLKAVSANLCSVYVVKSKRQVELVVIYFNHLLTIIAIIPLFADLELTFGFHDVCYCVWLFFLVRIQPWCAKST